MNSSPRRIPVEASARRQRDVAVPAGKSLDEMKQIYEKRRDRFCLGESLTPYCSQSDSTILSHSPRCYVSVDVMSSKVVVKPCLSPRLFQHNPQ
jgi:hypothetical protein